MNKKLKSFASNLMLVTGIITSIAGVIETVGKLVLSFRTKNIPEVKSISKSIMPEPSNYIPIEQISFFAQYKGMILIILGVLIISFSLWIIKRINERRINT